MRVVTTMVYLFFLMIFLSNLLKCIWRHQVVVLIQENRSGKWQNNPFWFPAYDCYRNKNRCDNRGGFVSGRGNLTLLMTLISTNLHRRPQTWSPASNIRFDLKQSLMDVNPIWLDRKLRLNVNHWRPLKYDFEWSIFIYAWRLHCKSKNWRLQSLQIEKGTFGLNKS